MIQSKIALIRRELWEHRAIYVAPVFAFGIQRIQRIEDR